MKAWYHAVSWGDGGDVDAEIAWGRRGRTLMQKLGMTTIMNGQKWIVKPCPSFPLLIAFLILFSLLSAGSLPDRAFSQTPLQDQYYNAVKDAEVAEPHEISRNLIAVVPWDKNLTWRNLGKTHSEVLVVTWTSWIGYECMMGQSMVLCRELWVTTVPEIRNFCKRAELVPDNTAIRLEQLLGLPPGAGKTKFVELWVKPKDLFRPSPDPEISDHEAGLDFPVSDEFVKVDREYKRWFNCLKEKSYGKDGYPWTRLGYTYDWGNPDNEIGLSEFVVRKGATVEIQSVWPTLDYCR
jgi:hypothetical protein